MTNQADGVRKVIELYYWPAPNGHKITMFLEKTELDCTIHPVNISAGDQFKPEFLAFSPDNRMPASSTAIRPMAANPSPSSNLA